MAHCLFGLGLLEQWRTSSENSKLFPVVFLKPCSGLNFVKATWNHLRCPQQRPSREIEEGKAWDTSNKFRSVKGPLLAEKMWLLTCKNILQHCRLDLALERYNS